MLKIYVAGPISAKDDYGINDNVQAGILVGREIAKMGFYPFIPHLYWFAGFDFTWSEWINFDDVWLRQCDALYYMSSSPGADIELEHAKELGMPIFFTLSELQEWKPGEE